MLYERWSILTSVFFVVQTITTVGYGYPKPSTDLSRMFTVGVISVGVMSIWAGLNHVIVKYILEKQSPGERNMDYKKKIMVAVIRLLALNLFGSFFLMYDQGFSYWEAIYFAVETTATVGYGDVNFRPATMIFLIFYMFIAAALFSYGMNYFEHLQREEVAKRAEKERKEEQLGLLQNLDFLAKLNDGNGNISKFELVCTILQHTKKLDFKKDIEPWIQVFDRLDTNKKGALSSIQLETIAHEERVRSKDSWARMKASEMDALEATSLKNVVLDLLSDYRTSCLSFIRTFLYTPILLFVNYFSWYCGYSGNSSSSSSNGASNGNSLLRLADSIQRLGHLNKDHHNLGTESPLPSSLREVEMTRRSDEELGQDEYDEEDEEVEESSSLTPTKPKKGAGAGANAGAGENESKTFGTGNLATGNGGSGGSKGGSKGSDGMDIETSMLDDFDTTNPLMVT